MDTEDSGSSPTSAVQIFNMRASDIKSVLELSKENRLETWSCRDISSEIRRCDSITLIGKLESQTIGFCIARLIMSGCSPSYTNVQNSKEAVSETADGNSSNRDELQFRCECEIYNIAVKEQFRRRGAGAALLQNLLWSAEKHHTESIWLEVRQSNESAIEFYRKNGFRQIYQRKNFYANPPENAIVMKKSISFGQTI